MPDISMCTGNDCSIKMKCYRYRAQPCEKQSYIDPPKGDVRCFYWLRILPDDVLAQEELKPSRPRGFKYL